MGLGLDQPSHWLIIAVLAMLLFGYKKMPEMARSAGRSLRIFKTEMKGMAEDDDARAADKGDIPTTPVAIAPVAVAPPAPIATASLAPVHTETVRTETMRSDSVPAAAVDPTPPAS